MSNRLSPGQLDILKQAAEGPIWKAAPEYWDPRPLKNDQIDRLAAREFLREDAAYGYVITDAGRKIIEEPSHV